MEVKGRLMLFFYQDERNKLKILVYLFMDDIVNCGFFKTIVF